jgi:predicted small lipoprotein YifL
MSRAVLIAMAVLMTAGCGVRRPLIPPADVPAYKAARAKKLEQRERNRVEEEQRQSIGQ